MRPSISGRYACTVPAPWPRAWLRPSLSGRRADNATPALHSRGLAEAVLQRPLSPARPHASVRHLTEFAAPTTPRPRYAHTVWLKPFDSGRRRYALARRAALCPHCLGCVAAAAAGTPWPCHARAMPARLRLCCCYCSED